MDRARDPTHRAATEPRPNTTSDSAHRMLTGQSAALAWQRLAGNRAVATALATPRVQRFETNVIAGKTYVTFGATEALPVNGVLATSPNFRFISLPESATTRTYWRRPRAALTATANQAAMGGFVTKYLEGLVTEHCTDPADRYRYMRLLTSDGAADRFGRVIPAVTLAQWKHDAQTNGFDHSANWPVARGILAHAWTTLPGTVKWAGVRDLFFPNPPARSRDWWIQYVYQEAITQDPVPAATIIDQIMFDVNEVRPAVAAAPELLRRYLRQLIAIGFFVMTKTDLVPHQQLSQEANPMSKVETGTGSVNVPIPGLQQWGIGFRSEDRTADQIEQSGGLKPKVTTTNPALRQLWNFDQPWFPFEPEKVYFRYGKGDNDLDTLVSVAANISDVSKFPLLEELNASDLQEVGVGNAARWTHVATISVVRVRSGLDTQAMQGVTEPRYFGHGEKAVLEIPTDDIICYLKIKRTWPVPQDRKRDSNTNRHTFTLEGDPDYRGRPDLQLALAMADKERYQLDPAGAVHWGTNALAALRAYLQGLKAGVVQYDSPEAGGSVEQLVLPTASTALAAKATGGDKRAKLEVLHKRAIVQFRVNYQTRLGQELCVVGDAPELGGWRPERGLLMNHAGNGNWEARGSLNNASGNRQLEYKYVVVEPGHDPIWETRNNRSLGLAAAGTTAAQAETWNH